MTHRQIIDDEKQLWDVWEVIPSRVEGLERLQVNHESHALQVAKPGRRLLVPGELQGGWLAFQCGEERRRLAPVPSGWSELSDDALMRMMMSAPPVRRTRAPRA